MSPKSEKCCVSGSLYIMRIGEVNSGGNFFLDGLYNPMKVQGVDKGV